MNAGEMHNTLEVKPGFTEVSFAALKRMVEKSTKEISENVFSLIVDEMAIRHHVEWDGKMARNIMVLLIWELN